MELSSDKQFNMQNKLISIYTSKYKLQQLTYTAEKARPSRALNETYEKKISKFRSLHSLKHIIKGELK